jgi:hypothetical protein
MTHTHISGASDPVGNVVIDWVIGRHPRVSVEVIEGFCSLKMSKFKHPWRALFYVSSGTAIMSHGIIALQVV